MPSLSLIIVWQQSEPCTATTVPNAGNEASTSALEPMGRRMDIIEP